MIDRTDDLLSDVLGSYRLRARVFAHDNFCGGWQLNTSGLGKATFYLIGRGSGWLHLKEGDSPYAIREGDLVVFPHDAWHVISGREVLDPGQTDDTNDGDVGPWTTVMCGWFDFGRADRNPVLDALPEMLLIRSDGSARYEHVEALTRLLISEADNDHAGAQHVLDRLAEALFVMVLRCYLEEVAEPRGFLAAVADPRLSRALDRMHRALDAPWTVSTLAEEAGMSRTAFAQRFTDLVGTPPLEYLTEVRMRRAEVLLREPGMSASSVCGAVGYSAEAAFRRAYKRVHGVGPGAVRRRRWGRLGRSS